MNFNSLFLTSVGSLFVAAPCLATDWVTLPSRYTHEPYTGQRVWQFAHTPPVLHFPQHGRNVYRHSRSSLQIGDSIDQYHSVDEYGHPVRPYGEWRFPFRPFSVPYPLWGPKYGGVGYGADDIAALTEGAFPQKRLLENAPCPIGKDDLSALYENALGYW